MTIYFDKNSIYWNNDNKINEYFLNSQTDYIRDLIKNRGYMYLNQIYEILGIKWEPKYENRCIEDAYFTVVIGWDCKQSRWAIDMLAY